MNENEPLLQGLRVIDAGSWIAAPAAATVLADFGADVVKLEPLDGDPLRALSRSPAAPESEHEYFWALDGRNKRSVALDLKAEAARDVVDALVRDADVLVTNYRPAVAERLGIDWPTLKDRCPRLIYAQVTGYGDTGPEAEKPGYDTTAWWSRSGLADHVRNPGERPALSAPGMGDHATAMSLFGGIMAALWARERSGRGRRVTTSLFANGLWSNGMLAQLVLCGATPTPREPGAIANALALQYETQDGRWLQLTLLNEAREWPKLLAVLGLETLAGDPRFADPDARREHAAALHERIAERFAALTAHDARGRLAEAGIPAAMLTTVQDVPDDAQALAADVLTPVETPAPGWTHTINSPLWLEGVQKRAPRYAPALGADTDAVLREVGLDEARIAALRAAGVIATSGD